MSRIRDIANILSGGSSAIATDAEITSAVSAQFVAGKNKIINGDFAINQRGFTSLTGSGSGQYGFDRWKIESGGDGSVTYTPQTFTIGTAPVTGYEAANFARVVVASQTSAGAYSIFAQGIEDVRTFANQTVTVSFWAKAASGTPKVAAEFVQVFGSGGSPSSNVNTYAGQATLTTSWARYTITANVPSIAGKTIGTTTNTSTIALLLWTSAGSTYNSRTGSIGIQNSTIDIWGVQVEVGSTATNFSLATGTFATELAACQRYYQTSFDLGQTPAHNGSYYGEMTLSCVNGGFNTNSYGAILFPTKMRTAPTVNIWNTRNASVSGNSARFYNSGTAYDTSSIDMGITTSSSHGMTFKGANIGASAIVFFGYSASAEL